MEINIFAYNVLHIIIVIFLIIVLYLHVNNIPLFLIFEKDNVNKTNNIGQKEINNSLSTNQQVISYTVNDLKQKVSIEDNVFITINDSNIKLIFDKNKDYTKENYLPHQIYKLGDVVSVDDKGTLRDFVNLVTDSNGSLNQNPLYDNKAWLEILIIE